MSIYNTENRDNDASNPYYGFDKTRGGQVGVSHYRTFAFNTQQLLNYSKAFGKHTGFGIARTRIYTQHQHHTYWQKEQYLCV